MIRFAQVDIGSNTAVPCALCATQAETPVFRPSEEISADVDSACRGWRSPPGPNVLFAGAEPFLHPHLPVLISGARSAGAQRIGVRTDGRALAQGDNARGSISAGVRLYEFVFLGGDAVAHDRLTAAPGSFQLALSGLGALRVAAERLGSEIALRGRVPVCVHNVRELPEVCAVLAREQCATIQLDLAPGLDVHSALPWLIAGAETGMVNGSWVAISGIEPSLLGSHALHATDPISLDGEVS